MQANWDTFYARVLKDEGARYEDVPGDNGGPTNCGITIIDVARYNGLKLKFDKNGRFIRGAGDWDRALALTKALNPSSAAPIYKKFYWDTCRADELPAGIDYMVVDFAVNSGVSRAVPTLCRLTAQPSASAVSNELIGACSAYGDPVDLINHYQDARQAYLIAISDPNSASYAHNYKFRNGWLSRVKRVRDTAIQMAQAAKPVEQSPMVAQLPPKAIDSLPPPPVSQIAVARQSTSVWVGGTGLLVTIMGHIHVAMQAAGDAVNQVIDALPQIVSASKENVQAFTDAGALVGSPESMANAAAVFGAVCVVIQIIRHVTFKYGVVSQPRG